jgi:raffinose/stachyose/melibiose transport system permease protein
MAITAPRSKSRVDNWSGQAVRYGICILAALLVLVPIVMALVGGLKTNAQLIAHPFAMPKPFMWENYTDVLRSASFWRQCGNSIFVMLATTLLVIGISSTAAFVFARLPF